MLSGRRPSGEERLMAAAEAAPPRGRGRYGPMAGGLMAVVMWGLAPVATRAAVAHLAPLPLLVLRLGLAAVVLLPWAVPVFRRLRPGQAGRLVAAGLLGLVGYNLPVTVGLQWLPAGTGGYRAIAGAALVLGGTLAFGAYTIVLRPLSQAFGAVRATAASTVVGA